MKNTIVNLIVSSLSIRQRSVEGVLALIDEGYTTPFIARYRKEKTGGMNEVQINDISQEYVKLNDLARRKETILKTITEQGKLSDNLKQRIIDCWNSTELEDIYLPYKPKRRTRAQVAREHGLEPLAQLILRQRDNNIRNTAARFVKGNVTDTDAAITGAQDIIAEMVSENEQVRSRIRAMFQRYAVITSKVIKTKIDLHETAKYSDYFDYSERLSRAGGNRILAIRRGEAEGILRVSIDIDTEEAIKRIQRLYVHDGAPGSSLVADAVVDAYKRLIKPSIENEYASISKQKADDEAIEVFAVNLRQLLLAAPLGQKRVMAVDPGIRTGCKVVCLDAQGNLLCHDVVYAVGKTNLSAAAQKHFARLASDYRIEAVAVGNGTASREVTDVVRDAMRIVSEKINVFVVSEDGASVYSASKVARDEFPNEDVTVRGAISIGRRLVDPLAELVKIDPKSIGVGQYQHDVDQSKLKQCLDRTIESCVNAVGVELNTASEQLLTYVSGLGQTLARNIVEYRKANGPFTSRYQLKKVPRLGAVAFTQCAGFLRIAGAENPLDSSAVHPESYYIVEAMARDSKCTVGELIASEERRRNVTIEKYVNNTVGIPTLTDIMSELEKPGRDPRGAIELFEFSPLVHTPDDLRAGMVLPGIVTNITKFGAFVDIGVHQDGLVHISQISDHYVSDPLQVLRLQQHVMVRVIEIDKQRNRISLSMRSL